MVAHASPLLRIDAGTLRARGSRPRPARPRRGRCVARVVSNCIAQALAMPMCAIASSGLACEHALERGSSPGDAVGGQRLQRRPAFHPRAMRRDERVELRVAGARRLRAHVGRRTGSPAAAPSGCAGSPPGAGPSVRRSADTACSRLLSVTATRARRCPRACPWTRRCPRAPPAPPARPRDAPRPPAVRRRGSGAWRRHRAEMVRIRRWAQARGSLAQQGVARGHDAVLRLVDRAAGGRQVSHLAARLRRHLAVQVQLHVGVRAGRRPSRARPRPTDRRAGWPWPRAASAPWTRAATRTPRAPAARTGWSPRRRTSGGPSCAGRGASSFTISSPSVLRKNSMHSRPT